MSTRKCEHCWHVTSSTTNGMGVVWFDKVRCCRCDSRGVRDWVIAHDPKHGPYCENSVFDYKPVRPAPDGWKASAS